MIRHWTFGQRIGAGFAIIATLALAIGVVAVLALRGVVASKDRVIDVDAQVLLGAREIEVLAERKGREARGFLLTGDERFVAGVSEARTELLETAARVREGLATDEGRRLLDAIMRSEDEHHQAWDAVFARRRSEASLDAIVRSGFEGEVVPARQRLDADLRAFLDWETRQMRAAEQASTDSAAAATTIVTAITGVLVFGAVAMALVLTRALGRQIGTAVGQVQSSSSELQAAANQQATGAREQATAMSEISTTISELLATSRQITESAQRVAQIAGDTTHSARGGEDTVDRTQESIAGIRRQVDLIVGHMLELGRKSQQIGAVLDIVSELAEQTNILAINATIEAAGAGDAGRRFAIVADEIRKLADRVAGSAKEIRGLIEDVRGAVNTTVMATETGSKSVDAGSKQFDHVAASFKQIASLVMTTTEAAREIELSTKQQMTAVEQVNIAIANIAQASKETETSSTQTLQTASQLAGLSQELLKLVRARAAA
jgi:methyl-accepting chemotaxis protein